MAELLDMRARDPESLAAIFRYYAEVEAPRLGSAVYTELCDAVADDPELLALAAEVRPEQPPPNVLLAAAQDLLLEMREQGDALPDLACWYPAVSGDAIPEASPVPAFRALFAEERDRLRPRLRTGRTQSCVVHRCTAILPALASLPRVEAMGGRVALLEIGPSAGLNLCLDRYRYDYGGGHGWGNEAAALRLECEDRGAVRPPLPARLEVVARRGLDLHPIDLEDPVAMRWLRALIWPEHLVRARAMETALAVAAASRSERAPIEIHRGDATLDLGAQIASLPSEAARVLLATHVFYQIPPEGRRAVMDAIARSSVEQPIDFVLMESSGEGDSRIEHFAFEEGARSGHRRLARSDSHGRWIAWADES